MSETEKADLQCRKCLHEWETVAEIIRYAVDEHTEGKILNYEITTCPKCGSESFWDATIGS